MAENSKIEWCDHTFNPWTGCTKVSPGCDGCYAEAWAKRSGAVKWGPDAERRRTTPAYWRQPLLWDKRAEAQGRRARVFCASLADVYDNAVGAGWRAHLFELIAKTPNLDWLLLTKRIGNARRMLNEVIGELSHGINTWDESPWPNVWLGATVVNQEEADRDIPKLLEVPARVRFLSIEPMLGPIDLNATPPLPGRRPVNGATLDDLRGCLPRWQVRPMRAKLRGGVDWVICGGESGPHARPMHPDWARSLRDQCAAAGVPFLFKQWGEWGPDWEGAEICDSCGRTKFDACNSRGECGHCGVDAWHEAEKPLDSPRRVGKKAAGRLLDSVEHNGFPRA